ncbi:MAG: tetratricopeptide repeat protein [Nitrospinae bacterium]|nr:tetratricopeptide repeat protein [Nitrospinota bacterium]MBL7021089.1 tetratricopeptide repeat protein [Nitrospinaceae bacterium]
MSFFPVETLKSEKWCGAVIFLFALIFSSGCATTELMPEDNKILAQEKFKEALQAGSLNQRDKMVVLLKEALELNPAEPNFHFFLGEAYFTQGDLRLAEQEYLTSIKLNNNLKDSYRQLGLVYMQQRHWEKAIQYFREDLALPGTRQPQQIYNWIALCFYNLGKTNEAESEWKKALEIKDNAGIRLNLALADINRERFDQAKDSLQKALLLRPRFSQAHFELAQLYLKENKKDQALDHFQKVILYSPRGDLAKKSQEYIKLVRPE